MAQTQPAGQGKEHMSPIAITQHLAGIDFPKSKADLVNFAEQKHAPQELINLINDLPDRTYNSMADVMEAVGKKL